MSDFLTSFSASIRAVGERRFIVLYGVEADCIEKAATLWQPGDLWLGQGPDACQPARISQTMKWLGQEYRLLFINGFSGLHPDVLGAAGGTVQAGGLLVLLMPHPNTWSTFADPDYRRYVPQADQASRCQSHFLTRLHRLLQTDTSVLWWDAKQSEPSLPQQILPEITALPSAVWQLEPDVFGCLSVDQSNAYQAIYDLIDKPAQPLVILADRGRGKSTALGLVANQLLKAGVRVILTAPALQSARTVLAHLDSPESLPFYSPDTLLDEQVPADLLLVDEAAAIPAFILKQLQERYQRVVYATTIHGYEGSGHGFEVRMCKWLVSQWPQMQQLTLTTPLRWSVTDPLEPLIDRILLLDAEIPTPSLVGSNRTCDWLSVDELATNEPLLRQVVGLLILAHYQTSPSDVRLILDSPDTHVCVWRAGAEILGVALLSEEGPIDDELASEIWAGRRRPRGQLLPQTLLAHCGYTDAGQFRFLRVMRIAIHPDCQQHGEGSQFLRALRETAKTNYDFIGCSFAATTEVCRFWRKADFLPVRIGLSKDTATGCHAAVMLNALQPIAQQKLELWSHTFQRDLPVWLGMQLNSLDPYLIREMLLPGSFGIMTEQHWVDIASFTEHLRSPDHCLPALQQLLQQDRTQLLTFSSATAALLIAKIWQGRSWQWLSEHFALSGQKMVIQALRTGIKKLLPPVAR